MAPWILFELASSSRFVNVASRRCCALLLGAPGGNCNRCSECLWMAFGSVSKLPFMSVRPNTLPFLIDYTSSICGQPRILTHVPELQVARIKWL
jgi:hypothetical protein